MVQLPHVPIAHLTFAPRSDPSAMDRLAGSPVLHSFIQTDFTWDPKSQHIGPVLWVRGLSPTGISNNTTTRGVQPVQRSNRGLALTAKQTFGIPRRGVCPQPRWLAQIGRHIPNHGVCPQPELTAKQTLGIPQQGVCPQLEVTGADRSPHPQPWGLSPTGISDGLPDPANWKPSTYDRKTTRRMRTMKMSPKLSDGRVRGTVQQGLSPIVVS